MCVSEVLSRSSGLRRALLSAVITWPFSCLDLRSLVLYCIFTCSQSIQIQSVMYYSSQLFLCFVLLIQLLIYLSTSGYLIRICIDLKLVKWKDAFFQLLKQHIILSDAVRNQRCDFIAERCRWFCVALSWIHFVCSAFHWRSLRGYSLQFFLLAISVIANYVRALAACAALDVMWEVRRLIVVSLSFSRREHGLLMVSVCTLWRTH